MSRQEEFERLVVPPPTLCPVAIEPQPEMVIYVTLVRMSELA